MNFKKYIVDYKSVEFRVIYSHVKEKPNTLFFSAHPLELLPLLRNNKDRTEFFLYGKIDMDMKMYVGFRGYEFEMNETLHFRIGKFYEIVEKEFMMIYDTYH